MTVALAFAAAPSFAANDLAAILGAQPTVVTVGDAWQVVIGLENAGTTAYPPGQAVQLYLSQDAVFNDDTDFYLDAWATTATLPAGAFEETTRFFSAFPDVAPGTWYLVSWSSLVDAVAANNVAQRAITVVVPTRLLSVSRTGSGDGTVTSIDPSGIDCGSDCSAYFGLDTIIYLSADSAPGSSFLGWSGDCTGTGGCNVVMSEDREVAAQFALDVVADFTFAPPSPQVGQSVQFTDASSNDASSWQWDFGDESPASTQTNPQHSFSAPGSYQVQLLVSNSHSSDSVIQIVEVSPAPPGFTASFAFSPAAPIAGEPVQFTDLSSGDPESWSWELGDGALSGLQHPQHSYAQPGTYTVRLTIESAVESATTTRSVVVSEVPDEEPTEILELGSEESFVPATVRPERPRVVFGPDGGKAVVWFQQGGGGTIICVQFFDANGDAVTQPLQASVLAGDNTAPTAAFDDQGRLHILWSRDEAPGALGHNRLESAAIQGSSVVGRTFDPKAQQQPGEFTVSPAATGESSEPESDSDRSGNHVVVWQDGGKVRGRLLDSAGNPRSATFDVNTGVAGSDPTLGVSASGDFVVAWQGVSQNQPAIFHRRYRDDGIPKANGELVSSAGSPANAAVGIDDAGNYIVVWDANGPSGRDIFAQRYRANGTKRGAIMQVNSSIAGDQSRPRVDVNAKGRFAIVWESTEGASGGSATAQGQSVLGRAFTPGGVPTAPEEEIATTESGTTPEKPDVSIDEKDDLAVVFERRGANGRSEGIFRKDVDVIAPPGACVADATTLCLSGDRFQVTALWEDPVTHAVSSARAVSLTDDTGYFWFFDAANVEVVTKALAACPINSRFWVFAAGLTNVEVTLRVDDVITGQSNTYFNRRDRAYAPILDTDAFSSCNAASTPATALSHADVAAVRDEVLAGLLTLLPEGVPDRASATATPASTLPASLGAEAACATDRDTLCVAASRFRVEVQFEATGGQGGRGQAIQLTNDTGYFWFFDPGNVEIVVKVLNACSIGPGRFWVFAAGLTNVEAEITVVDTSTGTRREYASPLGTAFVPIQDTNAFATCP